MSNSNLVSPSLVLHISGSTALALKAGQKNAVAAKAGQRYRVVKEDDKEPAQDVAATQQGQDLLLTYADGTQLELSQFYEVCKAQQCAVEMPAAGGAASGAVWVITGDSPVGASLSDGGKLVYSHGHTPTLTGQTQSTDLARLTPDGVTSQSQPNETNTFWTPFKSLGAFLGGAVLLSQGDSPVPTIIKGSVVAGPAIAGNGLVATAYKADGTVLATGAVNSDGSFSLDVGNDYNGPVLVKVSDTNASPDYFDEATGAPKDLTTDLRALAVIPAPGNYTISVNVLTELAVRSLGLTGGDTGDSSTSFVNLSATQIVQANQKVASTVGLMQDLVLGAAPVAIVSTTGQSDPNTNDYGRLLAALSGAEVGSSTDDVLNNLSSTLVSNQPLATAKVLELLVQGAAQVSQANLVDLVSDITNQKSTAITIDPVSQDNRISAEEMIAGVQVQGQTDVGASVTISWYVASSQAQATGTRTVTADAKGQWTANFNSAEIPGLGASTFKAVVGNAQATRSFFLETPPTPSIALDQVTDSSANLTNNGRVNVTGLLEGATYDYSLDGGASWSTGGGSSFTVTGNGERLATVRQNIGQQHSATSNALAFVLDTTPPKALTFALSNDSGTSASDGISSVGTVTVSGLESGATWQYSTNGGTTWSSGTGTSFTLAEASYAAGSVKVRQIDKAGNTGAASSNPASITIDATAPLALSLALDTDSGNATDGISNVGAVKVSGLESGATWQYSTNGGTTWSSGTGTRFSLAEATYAAGSIQVRQTDEAGNTSTHSGTAGSNTTSLTIDATAPSVTITSSATRLADGDTATITFTLSEAIDNFSANNVTVTVTGGALSNFSGSGTVYTATFARAEGLQGAATVDVAALAFSDAAGNSNSVASNTVSVVGGPPSVNLPAVAAGNGGFMIRGWTNVNSAGTVVSDAGDVNGDGLADLIVGRGGERAAAVVFGKTSGTAVDLSVVLGGTGGFVILGSSSAGNSTVSAAGDVNGDGLADVIVGVPFDSSAVEGRSYVVFGKTSGTPIDLSDVKGGIGGFAINGKRAGDPSHSGFSVSAAGDVNGDGLADLVVGAPGNKVFNLYDRGGSSYVVFGKSTGSGVDLSAVDAGNGGFAINGEFQSGSGASVSGGGDVNGDGLADLLVQVGAKSLNSLGIASYVVFGKTSGRSVDLGVVAGGTGGIKIVAEITFSDRGIFEHSDYQDSQISNAGDVNGDGLSDLIVGVSRLNLHGFLGRTYVVFGKASGSPINMSAVHQGIKQLFFCKFHELVLRRCAHAAGQGFIVR